MYLLCQKQFRDLAQGCKNLWVFQHERNGKFYCRLIAGQAKGETLDEMENIDSFAKNLDPWSFERDSCDRKE